MTQSTPPTPQGAGKPPGGATPTATPPTKEAGAPVGASPAKPGSGGSHDKAAADPKRQMSEGQDAQKDEHAKKDMETRRWPAGEGGERRS